MQIILRRLAPIALVPIAVVSLMAGASAAAHAAEVTAHRTYICLFEMEFSALLHPNKARITAADEGINPHTCHGTLKITGLGDGYDNLTEKCEGVRVRNFYVGAMPPNHHLHLGVCTLFRGEERVGTATYHGTPEAGDRGRTRKLYLPSHRCDQQGKERVGGKDSNNFTFALAPPDKVLLGGTHQADVIERYTCAAR